MQFKIVNINEMISPLLGEELTIVTNTIVDTDSKDIFKYFDLFVDYIDNPNLYEMYENLKMKIVPSSDLIKRVVKDAKTNQKLFQFIELLLKKF